jgi:1,3-beta-glucan synthase
MMCLSWLNESQFDFLMQQLTLHADYIGGWNANYRKWYSAALDLDDEVGHAQNPGSVNTPQKPTQESGGEVVERCDGVMASGDAHPEPLQQGSADFAVPECLCFIFKCVDDYYRSPECQNRLDPVPEGLYLRAVIKPLYRFIRDQGYESIDGKFVRRVKDHAHIIGYDGINQLFWYPEGIARMVLANKVHCCRK